MTRNAASDRQVQAADPAASTWLAANAGSGKTSVLTDRVARLLLAGTEPQKVLCLTYTKAAATEMQNRLFQRLGGWSMLADDALRAALDQLGLPGPIGADTLAEARRLFARAIETPGGLKIQTIHSFCAALLRRFPLEAGVPHDFREMEDRAADLLRSEIAEEMAAGPHRGLVDALARHVDGGDLPKLLALMGRNAEAFARPLDDASARALFDLPAGFDAEALRNSVYLGGEEDLFTALRAALAAGSTTDAKAGEKLAQLRFDGSDLPLLESVLLFGASAASPHGAKIDAFPTKATREAHPHLMPRLNDLMRRVEAARPRRIALTALEKTLALHRFGHVFSGLYVTRKAALGLLDFDDLIHRAAGLLQDRSVCDWVLYRLDGGIDHILVDEAQDTSPAQWQVIDHLSAEFSTGEGARGLGRTVFVVGDPKQSIYSFQGADLDTFREKETGYRARFAPLGGMQKLELEYSFRSAQAVLSAVDMTFDGRGNQGIGGAVNHLPFWDKPGRVDLWPVVEPADKAEKNDDWHEPVDRMSEEHHTVILARQIAEEIRRLIESGTQIPTRKGIRAVHPGDFLILVQRRSALFAEIIRACKAQGLPIAGADRLKLGAELAVKDITALLAFLATPEDDLSLAAVLRSPLVGWSEQQLFDLAARRGPKEYLWQALRHRDDPVLTMLDDLRAQADFLRPFELIERMLTRHGGRARLIGRLGPEAEDGLDELITQALAYEMSEVPSLTGFLVWLQAGEVEVKRATGSGGELVRVMTVHGSKGLEAPIVILPDTAKPANNRTDQIVTLPDGTPAWSLRADERPQAIADAVAAATRRRAEERDRLLYVAMTRAECWLIVAAAGDIGAGGDSWYGQVAQGLEKLGATRILREDGATVLRHETGGWPENGAPWTAGAAETAALPDWAHHPAPDLPRPPAPLSPSQLGGDKVVAGGPADEAALIHGARLHLLLEHLPNWPQADWPAIAAALLSSGPEAADPGETETVLAEATAVLTAPDMRPFLGPDSLAEVEIAAELPELGGRRILGVIDRLVVTPDRVVVIDYKSNAAVPDTPAAVPEGYLRQLGAYAAALGQLYPERQIDTAILWTAPGQLMWIPGEIVGAALRSTPAP